jgi:UDP-glucose 4-epimerase
MARILITGGIGAIGSNVTNRCVAENHDVTVVDDFSSSYEKDKKINYELIQCDISDQSAISKIFKKSYDYVIHLAAFFANQNSIEHPESDLLTNGLGSLNIAKLSAENGIKKVLYSSSSCVYSKKALLIDENTEIGDFDTPYAASKYFGEKYFELFKKNGGSDYSVVRIFNSYGPYENPGKYRNVIPNFFALASKKEPLPIFGSGSETRDFTYVEDVTNGILKTLFSEEANNKIFNIASGSETRIMDLAIKINTLTQNTAGIKILEKRPWDNVSNRRADISKASNLLGYKPVTSIDEGLEKTYEWFKSRK